MSNDLYLDTVSIDANAEYEVGDVVYFPYHTSVMSRFYTDEDTSTTYKVFFQGVVTYVHPTARWCSVQFGRNLRTSVFKTELIKTNNVARKLILIDSRVKDSVLDQVKKAASKSGAVVQVVNLNMQTLDSYVESYLAHESIVVSKGTRHTEYFSDIGIVSVELPVKYKDLMMWSIQSVKSGHIASEEVLKKLCSAVRPPEYLNNSALYRRVLIKNLKTE